MADNERTKSLSDDELATYSQAMKKPFPQSFTPEERRVLMKATIDGDSWLDMTTGRTWIRRSGSWEEVRAEVRDG